MTLLYAFLLILAAGLLNGSFALPTKYITKWKFENIWLQFSIWGLLILPWLFVLITAPQVLQIYGSAPTSMLATIMLGGFVFGIGQMCFACSLSLIGVGLGFIINIGLGISLGCLLPFVFQHADKIFTPFGIITLSGTLLSIVGLLLSNHAGALRNREKYKLQNNIKNSTADTSGIRDKTTNNYKLGIFLATIAGVFSAGQNFVFSLTYNMQALAASMGASDLGAANIIWPCFLTCAFVPYAFYTLYLHIKNQSFIHYQQKGIGKYYIFAPLMGLCWYIPLVLYSQASKLMGGSLGPLVGWPMFMVLIILTSSFWGWKHKEWEGSGSQAKKTMKQGLFFLTLAIIVLSYSSGINC